jgi:hypothetical protein
MEPNEGLKRGFEELQFPRWKRQYMSPEELRYAKEKCGVGVIKDGIVYASDGNVLYIYPVEELAND